MVLTNGKNDNLDPVALELAIDENGNIDPKKLGNNIAKLRKKLPGNKRAEMSQEELANAIIVEEKEEKAISVRTINSWECGKKLPSLKHLLKLCKVLDCDIDRLLGKRDYSTKELELICEYTGLTENTVKTFRPSIPNYVLVGLVSYFCEVYPKQFETLLFNITEYFTSYKEKAAYKTPTNLLDGDLKFALNAFEEEKKKEASVAISFLKIQELLSDMAKETTDKPPMRDWFNENISNRIDDENMQTYLNILMAPLDKTIKSSRIDENGALHINGLIAKPNAKRKTKE